MSTLTNRATGLMIGGAASLALALSGWIVFGLTDDSIVQDQRRPWVGVMDDPAWWDAYVGSVELDARPGLPWPGPGQHSQAL